MVTPPFGSLRLASKRSQSVAYSLVRNSNLYEMTPLLTDGASGREGKLTRAALSDVVGLQTT